MFIPSRQRETQEKHITRLHTVNIKCASIKTSVNLFSSTSMSLPCKARELCNFILPEMDMTDVIPQNG